jgi:hypothetical protein
LIHFRQLSEGDPGQAHSGFIPMVTALKLTVALQAQSCYNGFFLCIYGGTFAPPHFPVKKIMEGTPSPIKQHFTNTQFIGGMHYVSRESIYPFDPYRLGTEEGMLLTYRVY